MFPEYKVKSEYFFLLSADNLFCDLTPKSLESLDKIKQAKRFRKGAGFFSRGDVSRCIYILREGRAQLLLNDELEDKHIACLIEPNKIFGLTEALANLPYETDAETLTPCICDLIEREDFIHFLQDEPEVCFRLARLLALNFQKTTNTFLQ